MRCLMNSGVGMGVSYSAAAAACEFLSLETQIISENPLDSMWYVLLGEMYTPDPANSLPLQMITSDQIYVL